MIKRLALALLSLVLLAPLAHAQAPGMLRDGSNARLPEFRRNIGLGDFATPADYAAKGRSDPAKQISCTYTTVATSTTVTFASGNCTFTSADIGKVILLPAAGASEDVLLEAGDKGLLTTITGVTSSLQITVALAASQSRSAYAATVTWGWDDSTAINNASDDLAGTEATLFIDAPYLCAAQCILVRTDLRVEGSGNGKIIQGYAPVGAAGLVGQASFGTQENRCYIKNLQISGDPAHQLGGAIFTPNCNDAIFENILVPHYANPSAGRCVVWGGDRVKWYNPVCLDVSRNKTTGGFLYRGGKDSIVVGGHIESCDGAFQLVPGISGVFGNQTIERLSLVGVSGTSCLGDILRINLVDPNYGDGEVSPALSASIKDIYFSAVSGPNDRNRTVVIWNNNSSGTITRVYLHGFRLDQTDNYRQPQAVYLEAGGPNTKLGEIYIDGLTVKSPWRRCIEAVGPIEKLVVTNSFCDAPHAGQLDALAANAALGATSVTVTSATCALVKSGHSLGVRLDDVAANGAKRGRVQHVTASGDCSGNSVPLSTALQGQAGSGAAFWDYQLFVLKATDTVSSGNIIYAQSITGQTVGDDFWAVCDNGTLFQSTIAALATSELRTRLGIITLADAISCTITSGNWLANADRGGTSVSVLLDGVESGLMAESTILGGGTDVIQVGTEAMVQNFEFRNVDTKDIRALSAGILMELCDHCPVNGGTPLPHADSASSVAVSHTAALPTYPTVMVAANIGTGPTTLTIDNNPWPYLSNFIIQIDSEYIEVVGGFGTTTLDIVRARLGSSAGSHTTADAVTVVQPSTTRSPIRGMNVGALRRTTGEGGCAPYFGYVPGAGNLLSEIAGCDWTRHTETSGSSWTWAYTDIAEAVVIEGDSNTLNAVSLPAYPVRYSRAFRFYSGANTQTIASSTNLPLGTTLGGSVALTARSSLPSFFDAKAQKVYPAGVPALQ